MSNKNRDARRRAEIEKRRSEKERRMKQEDPLRESKYAAKKRRGEKYNGWVSGSTSEPFNPFPQGEYEVPNHSRPVRTTLPLSGKPVSLMIVNGQVHVQ